MANGSTSTPGTSMPGSFTPGSFTPGIHPILYAFFEPGGGLDREAMRRQVDACVAAGAQGLAVLGLATEGRKLDVGERRTLMAWAAEDLGRRRPLAVTIADATVDDQIAAVAEAEAVGADWVVLQPPPDPGASESDLIRFFGRVADRTALPVAIQNAPAYLGVGLSVDGLRTLARHHGNVRLVKAEGPAVEIAELAAGGSGPLTVVTGRGGLEMIDLLDAGAAGVIPAPEICDRLVAIWRDWASGDDRRRAAALAAYREVLPLIVFVLQSVDLLVCYGKRLLAHRLGLGPVVDRAPAVAPTAFGLACLERWSQGLGPLAPADPG